MNKPSRTTLRMLGLAVAAIGLLGVGVLGGVCLAGRAPAAKSAMAAIGEKQVLFWYDPMVPDQHFDKPGKSPFMDMQLRPRYASETSAEAGVQIDPGAVQNLGARIVAVEKGNIAASVTASGVIAFNERDVAVVQARAGGFVAKTYRRAVGDRVNAGDPLVDLRAPEWSSAIAEYLALRGGPADLSAAARRRLDMLGVPASAIGAAEKSGVGPQVFTVVAPNAGVITALDVREGMTIAPGAMLATINGYSPVWLLVSAPQGVSAALQPKAKAVAHLAAFPGRTFNGTIEALLPVASAASRTIGVRIALANPDGRLRPGMTAEVTLFDPTSRDVLQIPSEAVIRTGRRTLVMAALDKGRFMPTEVQVGAASGDKVEIISGLQEGQKIVASGQFLIGSEASLAGILDQPLPKTGTAAEAAKQHVGAGKVIAIDAAGVTISHGPIASMSWPAMNMHFAWGPAGPAKDVAVDEPVDFAFHQDRAGYVLDAITRRATP